MSRMVFLNGAHEAEIGTLRVQRTDLLAVAWDASLLQQGRLVWVRLRTNGDFLLTQCLSDRNPTTNKIVLLVRNAATGNLTTREMALTEANCTISNTVEDTPLALSYEAPATEVERRPILTKFIDEYKDALTNGKHENPLKHYNSSDFLHSTPFVLETTAARWQSDEEGASEGVAYHPFTFGQQPFPAGCRRRETWYTSQLLINIHLVLHSWAKNGCANDEGVWNMQAGEMAVQLAQSKTSRLTPQLFTIERCFLDWLGYIHAVGMLWDEEAEKEFENDLTWLRVLLQDTGLFLSLNPLFIAGVDLAVHTPAARSMVLRGVNKAFGLNVRAFPFTPADVAAIMEKVGIVYSRIRVPPDLKPSLGVSSLGSLVGMYLATEPTVELVSQFTVPFTHALELRRGDLILVGRMIGRITRVEHEEVNIVEWAAHDERHHVNHRNLCQDLDFNLHAAVVYYAFISEIEYRTTEWRHLLLLDDQLGRRSNGGIVTRRYLPPP